ncbi:MAG: hypothetical protein ACREXU_00590 [Gammaproteobacteria bacterium]
MRRSSEETEAQDARKLKVLRALNRAAVREPAAPSTTRLGRAPIRPGVPCLAAIARLRTEIGELSIAREAFAGVPAGEHEGDFVIRRLYLKAATGDGYVLVVQWAEIEGHRLASAKRVVRRPARGRILRPSPSPGRRLREGRPAFIVVSRRLPAAGSEARRPFVRPVRARGS